LHLPVRKNRKTVGRFSFFEIDQWDVEGRDGPYHAYVLRCADWVAAVALTDDERFVLVEQHRHGIDAKTLEAAGGVVDPAERPEDAARRELLEETGYAGSTAELLGTVHPNPALQSNRFSAFLVRGAHKQADPALESNEDVKLVLMSARELRSALRNGEITHALAVLAFEWALRAVGE
jgi:ADP-ribose pyrophosphatase